MATDCATLVSIRSEKCSELAALLRTFEIPRDREDTSLPTLTSNEVGNFYLLLVAICHQTSPKGHAALQGVRRGKTLRGWDFLLASLEDACTTDRSLLDPVTWRSSTRNMLHDLFGPLLTDLNGRAALIRDLGCRMLENRWRWADDLYQQSRGRIATGQPNLLGLLRTFRAYDDPVMKKSYFFLSLMRNTGIWSYVDPENLGPPVDYHEVRGHLRIGTVSINDPDLKRKVSQGLPVTKAEDLAIRSSVHDAIMLVSDLSGIHDPSILHYLFWNIFRSHCTRESPNCFGQRESSLPERYRHLAYQNGACQCPFSSHCSSARCKDRLTEHVFDTDHY